MIEEDIHRAVVVSDSGSVAGIVTPMDVLRALVRGDHVTDAAGPDGALEFVDVRRLG
jgi:CBS domain containing-hemolysin-like protein